MREGGSEGGRGGGGGGGTTRGMYMFAHSHQSMGLWILVFI